MKIKGLFDNMLRVRFYFCSILASALVSIRMSMMPPQLAGRRFDLQDGEISTDFTGGSLKNGQIKKKKTKRDGGSYSGR